MAHREERNTYFRSFIGHFHRLCQAHAILTVLCECCCRTNTNRRIRLTAKASVLPFITINHAQTLDGVVSMCVYGGSCVSAAFVFHLADKVQHRPESLNQPLILIPPSCVCVCVRVVILRAYLCVYHGRVKGEYCCKLWAY